VEIADLLTGPDAVLAEVKASGKKALLAELASRAATVLKLDERRLFDRRSARAAFVRSAAASSRMRDWPAAPCGGRPARHAVDFDRSRAPVHVPLARPKARGRLAKALARVAPAARSHLVDKLRAPSADARYALPSRRFRREAARSGRARDFSDSQAHSVHDYSRTDVL
jgi:PTS system nitrogen regulatory IIA component